MSNFIKRKLGCKTVAIQLEKTQLEINPSNFRNGSGSGELRNILKKTNEDKWVVDQHINQIICEDYIPVRNDLEN